MSKELSHYWIDLPMREMNKLRYVASFTFNESYEDLDEDEQEELQASYGYLGRRRYIQDLLEQAKDRFNINICHPGTKGAA